MAQVLTGEKWFHILLVIRARTLLKELEGSGRVARREGVLPFLSLQGTETRVSCYPAADSSLGVRQATFQKELLSCKSDTLIITLI